MAHTIIAQLHQYAREHVAFSDLAERLGWSQARLTAFFEADDAPFEAVHRVAYAMGLTMDITITPSESTPTTGT